MHNDGSQVAIIDIEKEALTLPPSKNFKVSAIANKSKMANSHDRIKSFYSEEAKLSCNI